MLVIEGDQYFSFPGVVIASYLGFSSSFWITNNQNKSTIRRSSLMGFRDLPPFSDVSQEVVAFLVLHLSYVPDYVIS